MKLFLLLLLCCEYPPPLLPTSSHPAGRGGGESLVLAISIHQVGEGENAWFCYGGVEQEVAFPGAPNPLSPVAGLALVGCDLISVRFND